MHDGTMHDATMHDGTMHDGTMQYSEFVGLRCLVSFTGGGR